MNNNETVFENINSNFPCTMYDKKQLKTLIENRFNLFLNKLDLKDGVKKNLMLTFDNLSSKLMLSSLIFFDILTTSEKFKKFININKVKNKKKIYICLNEIYKSTFKDSYCYNSFNEFSYLYKADNSLFLELDNKLLKNKNKFLIILSIYIFQNLGLNFIKIKI